MVCAASLRAPAALCEREAEEPVSYKFDRRRGARRAAPGWVRATFTDGDGRVGVAGLEVVDAGPAGMGVRSRCEIAPGMTVSLHPSRSPFAAVTGRVVRCAARGEGFELGISTFPGRAA
jgi:hypothetical protein